MKFKKIWNNSTLFMEIISVLFVSAVGVYIVLDMAIDQFGLGIWKTILACLTFIALMFFIEFMFRLFLFMLDSIK